MKFLTYFPIKPCMDNQIFGVNEGADYRVVLGLKGHPGQDLGYNVNGLNCAFGMPVRAAHDGKVISVEKDTNGGNTVVLITNEQFDYNGGQTYFKTIYAHLMNGSIKVSPPVFANGAWTYQSVKVGDVLGLCGSSGVIPGAIVEDPKYAHVHFGVKPAVYVVGQTPIEDFYKNSEQDNGYGGAVDPEPFWSGLYAEDEALYRLRSVPPNPILVQEVSLLTRLVGLLKQLLHL